MRCKIRVYSSIFEAKKSSPRTYGLWRILLNSDIRGPSGLDRRFYQLSSQTSLFANVLLMSISISGYCKHLILPKLEASDVDGTPVSVCDSSGSDCWLMECGYITCVGEWVHGGCNGHLYNPPPLSLSQWLSTSTTSPNTRPFVPCGVRKRDGTKRLGLL